MIILHGMALLFNVSEWLLNIKLSTILIGGTLRSLLVQEAKLHEASTSSASVHMGEMELITRNPQELHEITSLIAELMPPLPAGL